MRSVSQVSLIPVPLTKVKLDPSLMTLLGLGVVFVILSIIQGRQGKKGKTATAKWATASQIARSRKLAKAAIANRSSNNAAYYITEPVGESVAPPDLVVSNKSGAIVMLGPINRHLLVTGGTGVGKTENCIDPCLQSAIVQGMSIALFDAKSRGGQSDTLIPLALRNGYKVRVLAPGDEISNTFNSIDSIENERDVAGARERVAVLINNTSEEGAKKDSFFDPAGSSVLSGAFLMAKWVANIEGDPNLANILMVNQILKLPELTKRLIACRDRIDPWVYSEFAILTSTKSDDGKNGAEGGILATAIKTLAPLVVPNYLSSFCGKTTFPGFDPQDPLKVDGKQMIVFKIDENNPASTVPLAAMAIHQIVSYNLKEGRQEPLVVCLDEFHMLNLSIVLQWLAVKRYVGASIIIGIQYLTQLDAIYGKDKAKGFLSNCFNKVWFNPGDPDTEKFLSQALGEEELELTSRSKSFNFGKGSGNSRSENDQLHKKPLIEAHVIGQFPKGKCIIQTPGTGDKNHDSVPFLHQFSHDGEKIKAFKSRCSEDYHAIREMIINERTRSPQLDFTHELQGYTNILERLLPLNAKPTENSVPEPETEDLHVIGQNILIAIDNFGGDSSDFNIDPQKKYYVPPELKINGKLKPISIGDIPILIGSNNPF